MSTGPVTVEEVRKAQEHFKFGDNYHKGGKFREAMETFIKAIEIHPFDENHLGELQKKLKDGNFKLQQESIAYMGCAAVHLNNLINELDSEKREMVPIDKELIEVFKDWE